MPLSQRYNTVSNGAANNTINFYSSRATFLT